MELGNEQELIIVNAISQMVIPSDIFEKSEFKKIISDFKESQNKIETNLGAVESARNNIRNGNIVSNWWNDHADSLQDAQLDLNKSIGLLTKRSSELILFNTAISKVLVSQQKVLHEQQELLKRQASELAFQNETIKRQQVELSKQQEDIVKANQGLLEAKGLTREQAEKLVGCVKRVEAAEQKMENSNQQLERSIIERMVTLEEYVAVIKTDGKEDLYSHQQETALKIEETSANCTSQIAGLISQISSLDEKIDAESETHKLDIIDLKETFNIRLDELKSEYQYAEKNLSIKLQEFNNSLTTQTNGLESKLEVGREFSLKKFKDLWHFTLIASVVSIASFGMSIYLLLAYQ